MHSIEIDFEVFKALTNLRESEKMSYNDVIRQLLKLPAKIDPNETSKEVGQEWAGGWTAKGVKFPDGTEFRAKFSGETVSAYIKGRKLLVNGKKTSSLSQAARLVSGTYVNGWTFWECKLPGETTWRISQSLRDL